MNSNFDSLVKSLNLKQAIQTVESYKAALANPETDAAGREWCQRDMARAERAVEEAKRAKERWWE